MNIPNDETKEFIMRIQNPKRIQDRIQDRIQTPLLHAAVLSLALTTSCLAYSQGQPPGGPGGPGGEPPRMDVAKSLGVDAKTAKTVEQILREDHEKHDAVRNETNQKLAKVLSREQLEKLHQMMPRPPRGDGPPPRN